MTDFERYRIDKKYVKLLNDYYIKRMLYGQSVVDYNRAKADYRAFAKAENQNKTYVVAMCITKGSGDLPKEEYCKYYNKHCVPLTRMSFSEVQKANAANCKTTKEQMKIHQYYMDKAFINLKNYIEEHGYGSI